MKILKKGSISVVCIALFASCLAGGSFYTAPAFAAGETVTGEVSLPDHFKNIDNLKFSIKKLKNMFVSYSTAYSGNDTQLKTFISDLVSCLSDCDISAMESAGLSESLAETIVRLKVMQDEQKRIYDQFVRVMDEADVKRPVSNKMVDDAREVVELLIKNKDSSNSTGSIIYKYYGVNAKGHDAHNVEKEKNVIRGKSSFFGDTSKKNEASQIVKQYSEETPEKGKKITGMEFMDPVVARDNAAEDAAAKASGKGGAKPAGGNKDGEIKNEGTAPAGEEKKEAAPGKTE
ncbi:MAG: hypothetical protein BWY32_01822 [bacterium ADurb.Bin243]|nr:MAG: hypothetical protein BWY32_01822 [bacterium ADurb.Bin243]HOD41001.1 hypothetical protein [Candidatus Wallbacteria bacterium]